MMVKSRQTLRTTLLWLAVTCLVWSNCVAFTSTASTNTRPQTQLELMASQDDNKISQQRRSFIQSIPLMTAGLLLSSRPAFAADASSKKSKSLESNIYTILRVKEATIQETRLITSGKFKDAARGNVKLAVKFMLNNYKLSDAVIAASAFIDDNSKRLAASDAGQAAVQNLYTILEYFDAQDVANIKVGQADSMATKEPLVLKGLETTRKNIDDFLSYFPKSVVDEARDQVIRENEQNKKEWDPELGEIFNLPKESV